MSSRCKRSKDKIIADSNVMDSTVVEATDGYSVIDERQYTRFENAQTITSNGVDERRLNKLEKEIKTFTSTTSSQLALIMKAISAGIRVSNDSTSSTELQIKSSSTTFSICEENTQNKLEKAFQNFQFIADLFIAYQNACSTAEAISKSYKDKQTQLDRKNADKPITGYDAVKDRTYAKWIDTADSLKSFNTEMETAKRGAKAELESALGTRQTKAALKNIATVYKDDCVTQTCFEESDLIQGLCGALKHGKFFDDPQV